MKILDLKYIFKRIRQLVISPQEEWRTINTEKKTLNKVFKKFYIPLAILLSLLVLLICLIQGNFMISIFLPIINFMQITIGEYLAYLLIREYLNGKINNSNPIALNLTIYSAMVFVLFYSFSDVFNSSFINQLFGLFSLLFLRTLYTGVRSIENLTETQKTNVFIIAGLSIAFIPMIIKQLLLIVFEIPVFNL